MAGTDPEREFHGEPDARSLLCDAMLGSLVSYLRMCGYDTAYALDRGIEDADRLLDLAFEERRVLLTRNMQLAARASTSDRDSTGRPRERTDGLLLESRALFGQLREVRAAGFDLTLAARPTRCGRCNNPIEAVGRDEETPDYAPDPTIENLWRCRACGQCFWKGSHWQSVERTLDAVRSGDRDG